jgi:hypothetical protein
VPRRGTPPRPVRESNGASEVGVDDLSTLGKNRGSRDDIPVRKQSWQWGQQTIGHDLYVGGLGEVVRTAIGWATARQSRRQGVGERVGEAAQGAPVGTGLFESGCRWGGIYCQVVERASKGGPH